MKTKVCSFVWRILNKNKKDKKNFDRGFEPQIFDQNFPAQNLNFVGDWINRTRGS